MAVTGLEMQEKRLEEMGMIADNAIPGIGLVAFKGMFRYAIESALRENRIDTWVSVSAKDKAAKQRFLNSVLEHVAVRFAKLGLESAQIETVTGIVRDTMFKDIERLDSH